MPDTVRAFIAVELPPDVKSALVALQRQLGGDAARQAKWVVPQAMHLTLHFFGEVPAQSIGSIAGALTRPTGASSRLSLALAGAGCFPNAQRPRVLWVGLAGDVPALLSLQRRLDADLEQAGFRPESRPFSPHLTLARVRDTAGPEDARQLGQAVLRLAVPPITFPVAELSLIRSELRPQGPVYTTLATGSLDGPLSS